jgi:hypothetical protein
LWRRIQICPIIGRVDSTASEVSLDLIPDHRILVVGIGPVELDKGIFEFSVGVGIQVRLECIG